MNKAIKTATSISMPSAPGTIPPGFTPIDAECDVFEGKLMSGNRWRISSEWFPATNTFTVTPWTVDDDPMTMAEVREYSAAMLEMASYISTVSKEIRPVSCITPPADYQLAEGCSDRWIGPTATGNGWAVIPSWNAEANLHSVELWASELEDLSPAEALRLAAALAATAHTALAAGSAE